MSELVALEKICLRWGAPPAAAATMARQLLKRAEQLMRERGWSQEQALTYLLNLMAQGQAGNVAPEFQPPAASSPP
ncbi:MAG: hypothetical protein EBT98_01185 [Opitutaceae bacterium]|jgi:hypothetical protein|nr:hypothetical protein [Opitutaceae bacterium]NBR58438.1 hypothetical protein [Opitutaceae bacterium]